MSCEGAHLGLAQHAGSMIPGFFSLLHQCLLGMGFWIKVIYQDLSSILQQDPRLQSLDHGLYKNNDAGSDSKHTGTTIRVLQSAVSKLSNDDQ